MEQWTSFKRLRTPGSLALGEHSLPTCLNLELASVLLPGAPPGSYCKDQRKMSSFFLIGRGKVTFLKCAWRGLFLPKDFPQGKQFYQNLTHMGEGKYLPPAPPSLPGRKGNKTTNKKNLKNTCGSPSSGAQLTKTLRPNHGTIELFPAPPFPFDTTSIEFLIMTRDYN